MPGTAAAAVAAEVAGCGLLKARAVTGEPPAEVLHVVRVARENSCSS